MKKSFLFCVWLVMLLTMSSALVSCAHTCQFSDEWDSDKDAHWHACTKKDCPETLDEAEHVWAEGVVTTEATQEEDGIKTYTCTVCQRVREDAHVYTLLTREQWTEALSASNFQNFTYTETSTASTIGVEITTKTINYYTLNDVKTIVEIAGKKESQTVSGNDATTVRTAMAQSIRELADYDKYEYNAKTRKYEMKSPIYMESLGSNLTSSVLTFRDGKLIEIAYTCKMTQSGVSMDVETTISLTDYGVTKIS